MLEFCSEISYNIWYAELLPVISILLLIFYIVTARLVYKNATKKYESLALYSFVFAMIVLFYALFSDSMEVAECSGVGGVVTVLYSFLVFIPFSVWGYLLRHEIVPSLYAEK